MPVKKETKRPKTNNIEKIKKTSKAIPKVDKLVIKALKELKAIDITALNVRHLTSITDVMIICTGTSNRHVKSLGNTVLKALSEYKIKPISLEGESEGEWVLIDLGDVMVHIMQQKIRDFYQLEKLWDIPAPLVKKSSTTEVTKNKLTKLKRKSES